MLLLFFNQSAAVITTPVTVHWSVVSPGFRYIQNVPVTPVVLHWNIVAPTMCGSRTSITPVVITGPPVAVLATATSQAVVITAVVTPIVLTSDIICCGCD